MDIVQFFFFILQEVNYSIAIIIVLEGLSPGQSVKIIRNYRYNNIIKIIP